MSEKPRNPRPEDEFRTRDEREEFARMIASAVASELRGQRRVRDEREVVASVPSATPDNFKDRVLAARKESNIRDEKEGFRREHRDERVEKEREDLGKLLRIAAEVAKTAKERGIKPEVAIVSTDKQYKPKILPGDRPQKLKEINRTTMAEGWILARSSVVVNKSALIEEVMLGTDGALHIYTRNDQGNSVTADLHKGPATRKDIQDTPFATLSPPSREIEIGRTSRGKEYFHTVSSPAGYPYPAISEVQYPEHSQLTPNILQVGMEELFLELDLDSPRQRLTKGSD